eukprot:Rmarinus@m.20441
MSKRKRVEEEELIDLTSGSQETSPLEKENEELKKENQDLKKENQDLKKENQSLKQENEAERQRIFELKKQIAALGTGAFSQNKSPTKSQWILRDPEPRFWFLNDVGKFVSEALGNRGVGEIAQAIHGSFSGWYENYSLKEVIDKLKPSPFITQERRSYGPEEDGILLVGTSTLGKLDVSDLCSHAKPSPFGKGSETLYDEKVRLSMEIEASKLNEEAVDTVTKRISLKDLNPQRASQFSLEVAKLVIYPAGGHFSNHRDTVRSEDHVGTVVYFLNSDFEGGELRVRHGNKKDWSTIHPSKFEYVAMYGDCMHAVNRVTSGTKVALLFDIYDKGGPPEKVDNLTLPPNVIEEVRSGIDKQFQRYDIVAIILQHLYPATQINRTMLKGRDQLLWEVTADHYERALVPAAYKTFGGEGYEDEGGSCLCPLYKFSKDRGVVVLPDNDESDSDFDDGDNIPGKLIYEQEGEHQGNYAGPDEFVYLVNCLLLAKLPASGSN